MNHPSALGLTIGQKNMLKSSMKITDNKNEYRKLLAILQKGEGRTYHDIAKEHEINRVDLYKDGLPPTLRKGSMD